MGNIPIHPMIVHFPIVFAILLPVTAMIALFLIRKHTKPVRVWVIPFAISLILLATGVAGLRTGEAQFERGNAAIPQLVTEHRQAAHRFIVVATIVAIVTAAGLAPGGIGKAARRAATAGAFAVVVSVFQVGKAGAELAYHLNTESVASNP